MIIGKKFIVVNGFKPSLTEFEVQNGLQQGTVNAPILFNIYLNELIKKFKDDRKNCIAFADDFTIFTQGVKIAEIQTELQGMLNETQKYVDSYKLRINYNKCELVLFRPPVNETNRDIKLNWKTICLKTKENSLIKGQKEVKYLGVKLTYNLNFKKHVVEQVEKARKAFQISKKLFYSKQINNRVKILAYQSLIRPILTYASPIWYNINPYTMELLRKFERKCIRHCIGKYRKPETEYVEYIANKVIYESSKIKKIDNYIIKLNRQYYNKLTTVENRLINRLVEYDERYIKSTLESGFIPPEAFIFLDKYKYIKNNEKVPIIYHINRNATDKRIMYEPNTLMNEDNIDNFKFDTYQPIRDLNEKTDHIWWLNN